MRLRSLLPGLALATLPTLAAAQQPVLASKLDYTLNASRNMPIACKQGDIERHPGMTLAQLFGDKWPLQPEAEPGTDRVPAQMITSVRHGGALNGAPAQRGLVVFAVLVDASGKPLQSEVLCATTEGYDKITRRMAMASRYQPALINGKPVTSVVVHVQKFEKDEG